MSCIYILGYNIDSPKYVGCIQALGIYIDNAPCLSTIYQLKCPQLTQKVVKWQNCTSASVNWSEQIKELLQVSTNVGTQSPMDSHLDLNKKASAIYRQVRIHCVCHTVCIRHAIAFTVTYSHTPVEHYQHKDTQGRAYWDRYTHLTKCQTKFMRYNFKLHTKQHSTTQ